MWIRIRNTASNLNFKILSGILSLLLARQLYALCIDTCRRGAARTGDGRNADAPAAVARKVADMFALAVIEGHTPDQETIMVRVLPESEKERVTFYFYMQHAKETLFSCSCFTLFYTL